jgi:septal ring factor EnvC (AmiA/AmiB activator)
MSGTDNLDLRLVLRNTEKASCNAAAALEATERLVVSIGARFDSIDSRISTLESRASTVESRLTGVERRIGAVEHGLDGIARSNHRIEQMLADIAGRLPTPAP